MSIKISRLLIKLNREECIRLLRQARHIQSTINQVSSDIKYIEETIISEARQEVFTFQNYAAFYELQQQKLRTLEKELIQLQLELDEIRASIIKVDIQKKQYEHLLQESQKFLNIKQSKAEQQTLEEIAIRSWLNLNA